MERHDVLVIGGGLLGCALAHHLTQAGATVALVEKDQLNRHASGQNAGSLHFQLEYRMIQHGPEVAARAAEALPLHLDAMRAWASLEDEIGEPCGVRRRGGLMLAETPEQLELLARKTALERAHGLDVRVLDTDETHALAPYLSDHVLGAAWCPGEGKANPRLVTHAYARAAARNGAHIAAGTGLRALRHDGREWIATVTRDGRERPMRARAVVIAAGIWTAQVAAMADVRLPVIPVALSMTVTAATAPLVPTSSSTSAAGCRSSRRRKATSSSAAGGPPGVRAPRRRPRPQRTPRTAARLRLRQRRRRPGRRPRYSSSRSCASGPVRRR
ncbi:NAD(P)/FAD-dependent oxidoreductase [Yinghuangia aomiensis]